MMIPRQTNKDLRQLRWARHVACMKQSRNAYSVLVGKPEGKRPFREAEMQTGG